MYLVKNVAIYSVFYTCVVGYFDIRIYKNKTNRVVLNRHLCVVRAHTSVEFDIFSGHVLTLNLN